MAYDIWHIELNQAPVARLCATMYRCFSKKGSKAMRTICLLSLIALIFLPQTKDISGMWVAKRQTPNGEIELVYELKVKDGKITGTQKMPFGDSPIVDGKIDGDQFEFTVEMESF